jgi:hypothetical protein
MACSRVNVTFYRFTWITDVTVFGFRQGLETFSSPRLSDLLWGPHSPLSSGEQGLCPSLKNLQVKLSSLPNGEFKNAWRYSFTPLYLSGLVLNKCKVNCSFVVALLSSINLKGQ